MSDSPEGPEEPEEATTDDVPDPTTDDVPDPTADEGAGATDDRTGDRTDDGPPAARTAGAGDGPGESRGADPAAGDAGGSDLQRYVRYGVLAVLGVVALVATLRFYFAASNAITTWVTDEFRPLFQAAFNLVMLLAAGVGITRQLRRLR